MTHYRPNPDEFGYLVYDAPVDEKTKEIRKMFDVDETTGYPRHYNWRGMARLGNSYTLDEPFFKLTPSTPDDFVSSRVAYYMMATFIVGGVHYVLNLKERMPFWGRAHRFVGILGASLVGLEYAARKVDERNRQRHALYADYAQQHPERFGRVYRPKFRETLHLYTPTPR